MRIDLKQNLFQVSFICPVYAISRHHDSQLILLSPATAFLHQYNTTGFPAGVLQVQRCEQDLIL